MAELNASTTHSSEPPTRDAQRRTAATVHLIRRHRRQTPPGPAVVPKLCCRPCKARASRAVFRWRATASGVTPAVKQAGTLRRRLRRRRTVQKIAGTSRSGRRGAERETTLSGDAVPVRCVATRNAGLGASGWDGTSLGRWISLLWISWRYRSTRRSRGPRALVAELHHVRPRRRPGSRRRRGSGARRARRPRPPKRKPSGTDYKTAPRLHQISRSATELGGGQVWAVLFHNANTVRRHVHAAREWRDLCSQGQQQGRPGGKDYLLIASRGDLW